jgi:hypothetical protein
MTTVPAARETSAELTGLIWAVLRRSLRDQQALCASLL